MLFEDLSALLSYVEEALSSLSTVEPADADLENDLNFRSTKMHIQFLKQEMLAEMGEHESAFALCNVAGNQPETIYQAFRFPKSKNSVERWIQVAKNPCVHS